MQPYKLSGQRTWINCPWWIRTTITGSKDRCPAIGRRGSGERKLVQKLHRDNALSGAGYDDFRPFWNLQRRKFGTLGESRANAGHLKHRRSGSTQPIEQSVTIAPRHQRIDRGPPGPDDRLEIVDRSSRRRLPVSEHLGSELRNRMRHRAARRVQQRVSFAGVDAKRRIEKLHVSRRQRRQLEQFFTSPPAERHHEITGEKRDVRSEATR